MGRTVLCLSQGTLASMAQLKLKKQMLCSAIITNISYFILAPIY